MSVSCCLAGDSSWEQSSSFEIAFHGIQTCSPLSDRVNSVDSVEKEEDVISRLAAFCLHGGFGNVAGAYLGFS